MHCDTAVLVPDGRGLYVWRMYRALTLSLVALLAFSWCACAHAAAAPVGPPELASSADHQQAMADCHAATLSAGDHGPIGAACMDCDGEQPAVAGGVADQPDQMLSDAPAPSALLMPRQRNGSAAIVPRAPPGATPIDRADIAHR